MNTEAALNCLSALGHEHRLSAFRRLVQAGPAGMPVGDLRAQLAIPAATLTAHLNILRAAQLVTDERQGRVIRIRAHYGHMNALLAFLTEKCCAESAYCAPNLPCLS